jgi:multiple sugar transport system ATP-binding protein
MADVRLKNIVKSYDGKTDVVKKVSFDILDKEFMVLVGPSGCGKSTVLRMIAGLEEITSGDLYIDSEQVNDLLPKDRDIAMVFQNYALYPHMTVYQNMAFGLKIKKTPKKEIDLRVRKAAEALDITHLLDRKPKAMSGGQRQRVAIGRAIVRDPKVFLFDEPLSNLDAKLRVQMRVELQKLHKKLQVTIVYVTHDQTEAMTLGDRIVVLKDGNIMQIGSPMELYNSPDNMFVAGFIGSPPMNFIHGKIEDSGGELVFHDDRGVMDMSLEPVQNRALGDYAGKKVVFGIRPECIHHQQPKEDQPPKEASRYARVKTVITAIEQMGSEMLAYAMIDDVQIIARFSSDSQVSVDQPADIWFDLQKVYFFDPESGRIIK